MDTKLKGDIAEQAAVLHALKRGWGVLNQFAIRNSQFAITFCDGDLDPDTKRAAYRGRGLKPPKFVKTFWRSPTLRSSI